VHYIIVILRIETSPSTSLPGKEGAGATSLYVIPCPQKEVKFYSILLHKFITHRTGKILPPFSGWSIRVLQNKKIVVFCCLQIVNKLYSIDFLNGKINIELSLPQNTDVI